MNELVRHPSIPNELKVFAELPCLLPGENRRDYELLRQMMIDDIQPRTNIEWLWTFDLIELSWEVLRYRRLKQKVLETNRAAAIESILWDLDGTCLPAGTSDVSRLQNKRNAIEWRDDPKAAAEIEQRLRRHGWDAVAISAQVFVQARDAFSMLDDLMSAAQGRRIAILREIGARRERAKRAQNAFESRMGTSPSQNYVGRSDSCGGLR
jgi:hypothetical protein